MGYLFTPVLLLLTFLGFLQGGLGLWGGFLLAFVMHPLLDFVVKRELAPSRTFLSEALLITSPLWIFMFWLGHGWLLVDQASWSSILIQSFSAGIMLGVSAINCAHEFIHRSSFTQRLMGHFLLYLVMFSHWAWDHVYVHHRFVGTPEDPASARLGENIYSYFGRSFVGGFRKSLHLSGWVPALAISQILLVMLMFGLGYEKLGVAWIFTSMIAILTLQTVDYIEHYGISRKEIKPGIYESVKPQHSWDSYSAVTNWTLFNLGFHAHHHTRASAHFVDLKKEAQAQRMPFGYSTMFLMALVPPLWRKVMDKKIKDVGQNVIEG